MVYGPGTGASNGWPMTHAVSVAGRLALVQLQQMPWRQVRCHYWRDHGLCSIIRFSPIERFSVHAIISCRCACNQHRNSVQPYLVGRLVGFVYQSPWFCSAAVYCTVCTWNLTQHGRRCVLKRSFQLSLFPKRTGRRRRDRCSSATVPVLSICFSVYINKVIVEWGKQRPATRLASYWYKRSIKPNTNGCMWSCPNERRWCNRYIVTYCTWLACHDINKPLSCTASTS
jgi:hypothetical protein